LQAFVFDTYEHELLTGVLLRRLMDPAVAERALVLFFHFQRPELLAAEDHPRNEVFFPVVVLTHVLRELFALPLEVTYRFADAVALMQPGDYGFTYRQDGFFCFELSNQLRSDAIFGVWHEARSEWAESIRKELQRRVWGANSVVNGIRDALRETGSLFAWPPKFLLSESFSFHHRLVSRLAFVTRYEQVIDYIETRQRRMSPLPQALRDGDLLELTYAGGDRFTVHQRHVNVDIQVTGGFLNWILTDDSDEGLRARLSYDDYRNRERVWVPRNLPLALAAITGVESSSDRPNQALLLALSPSQSFPTLEAGGRYYLCKRYTDFNSAKLIEELGEIDGESDPAFVRLLEEPLSWREGTGLTPAMRRDALALAGRHGMTQSQLDAFAGVLDNRVQLVWGPPGTGKTHFLALALLCLTEVHRRAGLPYRVLVTAFTHAAIENCLRKVAELQRDLRVVNGGVAVGKLGGMKRGEVAGVEGFSSSASWAGAGESRHCVVGGTVWAIRKEIQVETADLVVIDEGSQLKVPDASIAIRRVGVAGRLVIAGDDKQLPPIVQGAYPDPDPGDPLVHRSIFECLREQEKGDNYTAPLLENFRMNRTLCRYPAEQVYLPDYTSATEMIARRRLALSDDGSSPLEDLILEPRFPLVVGVLEGVRATAENRVEAALVASVTVTLRSRLLSDSRTPYPDDRSGDRAFWSQGLFIVSPHRVQINAVRRALSQRRRWLSEPFVDTVDKMQGQECDAVIATYGVSDVEYAMREKEFIYSLNRLNVAITRARAKTVLLLPRPLIEPPIHAFEDDRIASGIAFMQGLVQFAEHHGERTVHPLGHPARLELLRVPESCGTPDSTAH
jgi:DNA replication ATP-dependent helicase Dna2